MQSNDVVPHAGHTRRRCRRSYRSRFVRPAHTRSRPDRATGPHCRVDCSRPLPAPREGERAAGRRTLFPRFSTDRNDAPPRPVCVVVSLPDCVLLPRRRRTSPGRRLNASVPTIRVPCRIAAPEPADDRPVDLIGWNRRHRGSSDSGPFGQGADLVQTSADK